MGEVLRLVGQRLLLGVFVLWIVSLIIFLGVSLLPGDVATEILGQAALPETVAAFRRELGLDLPLHVRYVDWLGGVLTGDLDTLPDIVRRSNVTAPTLIIIGEVVKLRDQLKWFEPAA